MKPFTPTIFDIKFNHIKLWSDSLFIIAIYDNIMKYLIANLAFDIPFATLL